MSEKPTNRERLKNALTTEISARTEKFCSSIDHKYAHNGRGPAHAELIRERVQKLLDQIDSDLNRLTDEMTPRELLQTICQRILHTTETQLLDIPSLPKEIRLAIRRNENEIRKNILHDLEIHPWTRDKTAIATVASKRERPERNTKKVSPPQAKPSTTPQLDEFDQMARHESYARNPSTIPNVAMFAELRKKDRDFDE